MIQRNTLVADKKFIFDRILESYRFFFRSFFSSNWFCHFLNSHATGRNIVSTLFDYIIPKPSGKLRRLTPSFGCTLAVRLKKYFF